MKKKVLFRLIFLLGFLVMGSHYVFPQAEDLIITGKINDADGENAVGAVVLLKGTTSKTVTDEEGYFSMKVPAKEVTLVVTHFSSSQDWEFSFEAGRKHIIRLGKDSLAVPKQVFDRVEENPRPTYGNDGFYSYLAKNIKYPTSARDSGIEGTVIVGFEVAADGSIRNAEVLRGIGGECDQEALRVVSAGPNWYPGKIAGEPVNTRRSIAIQFKMHGSPSTPERSKETAIAKLYEKEGIVVISYSPTASL